MSIDKAMHFLRHLPLGSIFDEDRDPIPEEKDLGPADEIWLPADDRQSKAAIEFMRPIKETDQIWDLGSGDGRLLIAMAIAYGAKCVGVEINYNLYKRSIAMAEVAKMDHLVSFRHADFKTLTDLGDATVVFLHLWPEVNEKLRPLLEKQLRPGSRVISLDYNFNAWPHESRRVRYTNAEFDIIREWRIGQDGRPVNWLVQGAHDPVESLA